jgi:hypothetical protein
VLLFVEHVHIIRKLDYLEHGYLLDDVRRARRDRENFLVKKKVHSSQMAEDDLRIVPTALRANQPSLDGSIVTALRSAMAAKPMKALPTDGEAPSFLICGAIRILSYIVTIQLPLLIRESREIKCDCF